MANQSISNIWGSYLLTEGFQLCLCDESVSFSDTLSTMSLILRSSYRKKLSASIYVKEGKDLCISRGMHHVEDANTFFNFKTDATTRTDCLLKLTSSTVQSFSLRFQKDLLATVLKIFST